MVLEESDIVVRRAFELLRYRWETVIAEAGNALANGEEVVTGVGCALIRGVCSG